MTKVISMCGQGDPVAFVLHRPHHLGNIVERQLLADSTLLGNALAVLHEFARVHSDVLRQLRLGSDGLSRDEKATITERAPSG